MCQIEGDLFYPMDSSWVPSDDLFPTSPRSKEEYANLNPFQVFSTWAGLAVLAATPFLEPHRLRFRRSDGWWDECAASECSLIANDFWKAGWGRVQVVPSVQVRCGGAASRRGEPMCAALTFQVSYERNVAEDILEELSKQKKELGWEDGVPPDWRDPHVNWIAE
jgi:alpha-1,3-mannosyltransferase